MSIDPKLTWMVYIGAAVIFTCFVVAMFVYSNRMKARKAVENTKGRKEASVDEGIAIATEGPDRPRRNM